jgi:hypothetical protein
MAVRGSRGTSSLFTPLNVMDVLIPTEVVQYNERKHWASLIQPFLETLAVLVVITVFAGGLPSSALGGFLFIAAMIVFFLMFRQRKVKRQHLLGIAAGIVVGFLLFGYQTLTILLVVGAFVRFVHRFAMWAFYEKLFITNRRVIQSQGFLGARIAAMPLTRITDFEFSRSVVGEILDYGTFRLESAGQDQGIGNLPFLHEPDVFYNILVALSTSALGSVKDPLSKENMEESRAHTVKATGTNRPASVSLRNFFSSLRSPMSDLDDGT